MQFPQAVSSSSPVTLHVGRERWQFSIAGVTRVGNELFISAMLQGTDVCTAVIHVHDRIVPGITVRALLERVCEWLTVRRGERYAYLELAHPTGAGTATEECGPTWQGRRSAPSTS